MFFTLVTLLLSLQPFLANASNDWSSPCAGSCAYEVGDGTKTAFGSILLDGAQEAISDISTAAGWSIMDCDSGSQDTQVIRAVCHNPDAGCGQLYEGGAVNTIVRLPEECADAPFARIANITTASNQTLTDSVSKRVALHKRASNPEVMTITIDYNFHLIPASRGTISLTALATTNPLQRPLVSAQRLKRALGYGEDGELNARSANSPGELVRREILRRDLFAEFVGGNVIPAGVTDELFAAKNEKKAKTAKVGSLSANSTDEPVYNAKWQHDWDHTFELLDIHQAFPVVDAKVSCPQNGDVPAFDAAIKVDADVNVKASVTVGFIIAGTIIPPKITKAAFTSALDGGVQAAFNVQANAQGSFSTGLLPLYTSGLAGMSIPGILDIGPTFSINGQGNGKLGVAANAVVKANYNFPGLSMVYPPEEGNSNAQASQGDGQNPLVLSIGGSASLTGTVQAHIIPRVDLGVSVLSGIASASVFLQLDGYGSLDMSLSVEGSASTSILPSAPAKTMAETETLSLPAAPETTSEAVVAPTEQPSAEEPSSTDSSEAASSMSSSDAKVDDASTETTLTSTADIVAATGNADPYVPELAELPPSPQGEDYNATEPTSQNNVVSTRPLSCPSGRRHPRHKRRDLMLNQPRDNVNFGGCVGVEMGVKIVVGAQGKLLSFWKDSVSTDLFSQSWKIFEKCFQTSAKRSLGTWHGPVTPSIPHSLQSRQLDGLICPAITDSINALTQVI
ncbi:hypothetical protein CPB86DRAFT_841263 [Serendipita vermifera]|nr:hypothetical protein CPB86DRAFT_841263 [Serendipita vermifera]